MFITSLNSLKAAGSDLTKLQVAVLVTSVLLVAGGALLLYVRSRPREVKVEKQAGTAAAGQICVHVDGAVRNPGLYRLAENSRVSDALEEAGGTLEGASLASVNLAQTLKDGQKVTVQMSAPPAPGGQAQDSASTASGGSLINLNTASVEQLQALPGIGPALAERIMRYREKNGGFSSFEQLDEVEGIGPSKMESLKDLVTI